MFDVLDAVVVAVEHLTVDDQPEGVGACHFDKGVLAVVHEFLHVGTVDMGALAVFVDEAGELE